MYPNSEWKIFLRHVPKIVEYVKDPESLGALDRYAILCAFRAGLEGVHPGTYIPDMQDLSLMRGFLVILACGAGWDARVLTGRNYEAE